MTQHSTTRYWLLLAALGTIALSGCRSIRLPAIDPQGQSIFLPGDSTTLVTPQLPPSNLPRLSCLPTPAWKAPPSPPKCDVPGGSCCVAGCNHLNCGKKAAELVKQLIPRPHAGRCGQIQMTPTKVVAPVGEEVVLKSGVCGPDGYLVTSQPLEWIITPDSVGHFVGIGDTGRPLMSQLSGTTPRKYTERFAFTHTSTKGHLLTRGTRNPADDVAVEKGQGWVSVTSPTEGVSYVTTIAPKTENWEERRETAIIHWIDAKWTLPEVANQRAGQPHVLTTRVTRGDGSPLPTWHVRYQIVDGPPAEFNNKATDIVVPVNASGEALAELRPLTLQAGSNRVQVEILRPGGGRMAEQTVGRGFTTVRWSSPGLRTRVFAPEIAEVDSVVTYRIEVFNDGDMTAHDVEVNDRVPVGLQFLSGQPEPEQFGEQQRWRLGDLAPGDQRILEVNCRAVNSGDFRYCATASSQVDGIRNESCAATRVFAPALQLRLTGPEEAGVGEEIRFVAQVTNIGDVRLDGVLLEDTFDSGLEHISGRPSPIRQREIGSLEAGDSAEVNLTFIGVRPGSHCHTLVAMADGGHRDSARSCVTVRQRGPVSQPEVAIRVTGPQQATVGGPVDPPNEVDDDDVRFLVEVQNTGNVALRDVQIIVEADSDALNPKLASDPKPTRSGRRFVWEIPELPAGAAVVKREVVYNCDQPGRVSVGGRVVARGNVSAFDSKVLQILPAREQEPPPRDPATGPSPRSLPDDRPPAAVGQLKVSVADTPGSSMVGEVVTFLIDVRNSRNVSDRNVVISVDIPEGLDIKNVKSRLLRANFQGRTIQFDPLREMRAGEDLDEAIRVEVSGNRAGTHTVRVRVSSDLTPNGIETEEATNVFDR